MDQTHTKLSELAKTIIEEAGNQTLLVFANNSVGKTTLSRHISSIKGDDCLCFNTFVEETFVWENNFEDDEFSLTIDPYDSLIGDAVIKQGLEPRISEIFKSLIDAKIDPMFETENGRVSKVTFSLATGDNARADGIKLSKGEESVFIWSVFCAIAEMILEEKSNDNPDYDSLNYIIIDDPITSLSEERIVAVALEIKNMIINKVSELKDKHKGRDFGILITTHNRLLYNVLFPEIRKSRNCLRLSKSDEGFILVAQKDSPFGYHLEEIKIIKNTIDSGNDIKKIHFNMFRSILEKTASFFGYSDGWSECLNSDLDKKGEFVKFLNFHSHDRLIELDDKNIEDRQAKELFKTFFNQFLKDYKWNIK